MSQPKKSQLDSIFESSDDHSIPELKEPVDDSSDDSYYQVPFDSIQPLSIQSLQSPKQSPKQLLSMKIISSSPEPLSPIQIKQSIDEPTEDSVSSVIDESDSFDSDEQVIENQDEYDDCLSSIHTKSNSVEQSTYHIHNSNYPIWV